jgi:hypothetical protein
VVAVAVILLVTAAVVRGQATAADVALSAHLTGFEETPPNLTNGTGTFSAVIHDTTSITYTLTYSGLSAPVTQTHIHFGQKSVAGGVAIFLCGTTVSPGPAGTPTCPQAGTVTRTITAADVIGPTGQGIAAGDLTGVIRAILHGEGYVNVHTTAHPGGEIRGQVQTADQGD